MRLRPDGRSTRWKWSPRLCRRAERHRSTGPIRREVLRDSSNASSCSVFERAFLMGRHRDATCVRRSSAIGCRSVKVRSRPTARDRSPVELDARSRACTWERAEGEESTGAGDARNERVGPVSGSRVRRSGAAGLGYARLRSRRSSPSLSASSNCSRLARRTCACSAARRCSRRKSTTLGREWRPSASSSPKSVSGSDGRFTSLARRAALVVDAPPQLTPDAARVLLSLLRSTAQTRDLETDERAPQPRDHAMRVLRPSHHAILDLA